MIKLLHGDCLELLKDIPTNSIESIVTDPPYGINFMGKSWDKVLPPTEIWAECRRVLKPGGYLVAMSASRTYHRLAVQLEDLNMICHPMIGWIYGSGFPKATDLSKQFDKQAGLIKSNKRFNVAGQGIALNPNKKLRSDHPEYEKPEGKTDLAKKWTGYKYGLQSLKPALEPIAVFQKPWKNKKNKRMTDNVKEFGVGAFNIDACRVDLKGEKIINGGGNNIQFNTSGNGTLQEQHYKSKLEQTINTTGRHPANLLHDGSESVEAVFKKQTPHVQPCGSVKKTTHKDGMFGIGTPGRIYKDEDTSTASRFFNKLPITDLDAPFLYTAKPSKRERNAGLDSANLIWQKDVWEKQDLNSLTENINQLSRDISDDLLTESKQWNTDIYGHSISEQYPKGMIFTISTVLKMIIELKTSNVLQNSIINDIIRDVIKMIEASGLSLVKSAEYLSQSNLNTINEKTASLLGVALAVLPLLSKIKEFANSDNFHSTVKPLALMEWLIKLVTPEGGTTLDPFMGSGTSGIAAKKNGFDFIGMERTYNYFEIAEERINDSTP